MNTVVHDAEKLREKLTLKNIAKQKEKYALWTKEDLIDLVIQLKAENTNLMNVLYSSSVNRDMYEIKQLNTWKGKIKHWINVNISDFRMWRLANKFFMKIGILKP